MIDEVRANGLIDDAMDRYYEENRRMQNGVLSDLDDVRKEISDLLIRYSEAGGTINKNRLRTVLRELEIPEEAFVQELEESVDKVIDVTIERAINLSIAALGTVALAGIITNKLRRDLRDSVLNRDVGDGLSFKDRMLRTSGGIYDSIRTAVRSGILQGLSVTAISRSVLTEVRRKASHIRRIVMTEGYNTYRLALGEVARVSGLVRAVKIIDNRGRHRNHESHECYRLAEQDMYGWGKGVYRVEDRFIYFPHPQCTAYFRFVANPSVDNRNGGAS